MLKAKLKKKYPDQINFADISHIYAGYAGKDGDEGTTFVMGGLAGATAALSAESGRKMRSKIAETNYGVWLNVKGSTIYLADALTEAQATYLYSDLSARLGVTG